MCKQQFPWQSPKNCDQKCHTTAAEKHGICTGKYAPVNRAQWPSVSIMSIGQNHCSMVQVIWTPFYGKSCEIFSEMSMGTNLVGQNCNLNHQ